MILKLLECYQDKQDEIDNWLDSLAGIKELPIYTSIDVRDAEFKIAAIDTNLFPAGFNNLCMVSTKDASMQFKKAVNAKVETCKNILIICEEHTRNKWYLENIYVLQEIAKEAGYNVTVATFMQDSLGNITSPGIELETAEGNLLYIHRLRPLIESIQTKEAKFDMIILNNDLTEGVPEELLNTNVPIYPSPSVGWHSRKKSHHFECFNKIAEELCQKLDPEGGIDPWFLSTKFEAIDDIDINNESDREKLYSLAKKLFEEIQALYKKHKIQEKPFIFLKADSGTYGMGVIPIHSPEEILDLNRKTRNKLYKGKGSIPINRYILQEGVPSSLTIDESSAEVVMYTIANTFIGSFYRVNSNKNSHENLNSIGMRFERMCLETQNDSIPDPLQRYEKSDFCGVKVKESKMALYKLISKLSGIAAHFEKEYGS